MSGRTCSAGRTVFFKALALAREKAPHRCRMHFEAARRQGLGQRLQRHMRRLFDLPQDKKPVLTADREGSMAAHTPWRDAAKTPRAGRPFDDARYSNAQRRRDPAAALAYRQ